MNIIKNINNRDAIMKNIENVIREACNPFIGEINTGNQIKRMKQLLKDKLKQIATYNNFKWEICDDEDNDCIIIKQPYIFGPVEYAKIIINTERIP